MSDEIIEPRKRTIPEHPARIVDLFGELTEDHSKVRVSLELDRGDTKPDINLSLIDKDGNEVSRADIIELFGESMAFTMHIRQKGPIFPLILVCRMSYVDDAVHDERKTEIRDL
jgi:hypothetical protein